MDKQTPAEMAAANPFRYFTFEEVGEIFGFGRDTIAAFVNAGAPVVSRKINPRRLDLWLSENEDKVGKVRP